MVVGILIAVNIDDWNETVKVRNLEKKILESLHKEFTYNKKLLEGEMVKMDSIIENALLIAQETGPKVNADEHKMAQLFFNTFRHFPSYNPSPGTLNEVINSGRLSIISNDSLRLILAAWPQFVKKVSDQENYVHQKNEKTHEYYFRYGNFRRHLNLLNPNGKFGDTRFPKNDYKFLEQVQFENDLIFYVATATILKEELYPELMNKLIEIDNLILSQMKKKK